MKCLKVKFHGIFFENFYAQLSKFRPKKQKRECLLGEFDKNAGKNLFGRPFEKILNVKLAVKLKIVSKVI